MRSSLMLQILFMVVFPGIHEILRRQGLLAGRWCLNPSEELSPGQMEEIDRIYMSYPSYNDDEFVKNFLEAEKKILQVQ